MNGNSDDVVTSTSTTTTATEVTKKPLSLLILLNQSFSKEQKQLILHKLNSSLNQINDPTLSASYIIDLKQEIDYVLQANQHDAYSFDQEYRIASKNDNFEFELLINGTYNSLKRALNAFLQSPTKIKNLIYAGIDHNGSSSLVLQDSSFSYDDFHLLLNDYQTAAGDAIKQIAFNFNFNSKYIHENESWKHLEKLLKNLKFLQPTTVIEDGATETVLNSLTNYVAQYLNERPITDLMEETKLTGTLSVERPALYIFPSREGDSSYFTFNGYSMLVNGGYDRVQPSFWRFASMLKQIDSVLVTHQDSDALGGISSLFAKKLVQPNVKPNILSVFGNLVKSKQRSDNAHNDADVILHACDELKLKVQPLAKHNLSHVKPHQTPEHVNLYFKHGYGSLDMYVLSPFANSAEYKEFLHNVQGKVQANIQKSHLSVNQTFKNIPLSHLTSAVVLLAWTPSKANDNAVRILFTGNAPQHVVALALEKVKDFDLLQTPVYKIKEQKAASNQATIVKKPPQQKVVDKVDGDKAEKPAAAAGTATNGTEKKVPVSKPAEKSANDHGKGDRALNTSVSKPVSNGTGAAAKPVAAAANTASKPVNVPKPATNGHQKRESAAPGAAANVEAKKSEASKKSVASGNSDEHKEQKEVKKPIASAPPRPPAPKKEEAKAKVEPTRASLAPTASKSEHNTKATGSTAATATAAAAKPRPSSAKPNAKPEKEKEEKKPAAPAPAKAKTEVKSKSATNGKDTKVTKPAVKQEAKPAEVKPAEQAAALVVEEVAPPQVDAAACYRVEHSVEVPQLPILEHIPLLSTEQVEPVVESPAHEEVELKQDIEQVLVSHENGHHEQVAEDLPEEQDQEELVRREVAFENKSEFVASECVPIERTANDDEVEKAEQYINAQNVEEDAELLEDDQESEQNHIASDDSPNLSPVKPSLSKESISSEDDVAIDIQEQAEELKAAEEESPRDEEVVEPAAVAETEVNLQEVEVEDQACRRVNLELNLDDVAPVSVVQPCVVDDPREFIQTPQHSSDNSPVVENAPEDDVMTRSFIDNGEALANPFNLPEPEAFKHSEEVPSDDTTSNTTSSNDDSVQDYSSNAIAADEPAEKATPVEEPAGFDNLIDGFKSMNIEKQSELAHTNGHHTNGHTNGHHTNGHHENGNSEEVTKVTKSDMLLDFGSNEALQKSADAETTGKQQTPTTATSDPSTWNLLELPKPVIPVDQTNGTSTTTASAATTNGKVTTPNGKRNPPLSSSSPTSTAPIKREAPGGKALNNSTSKPSASAANTAKPTSANNANKGPAVHPLYFEVSYIPAHGNQFYVDSEFFKRVRSRFYVLSTIDPSQHVLNSLLEAKQSWEDKELQVSIVPTYESDTLRHWFILNAEQLAKNKIDILPAANLTTLTIDNNTDFAYQVHKLEF